MLDIIIPALNEENYIGSVLKSLTKQTFKDFNVTLVDGNSKDKTVAIAYTFTDKLPLRIIISKKKGVSHQRNVGAKEGTGKKILFLDADMILPPHFLEELLTYVKDREVANCWLVPLSSNPIDKLGFQIYNIFFLYFGHYFWPVGVGNNLYFTRRIFEKIGGFDENISAWEDVDVVRRAINAGGEMAVLRRPKIYTSIRRFEMQGRLNYVIENYKGMKEAIKTGKIPDQTVFNYPMGLDYGALKARKREKKSFTIRTKKYLARLNQTMTQPLKWRDIDTANRKRLKEIMTTIKKVIE